MAGKVVILEKILQPVLTEEQRPQISKQATVILRQDRLLAFNTDAIDQLQSSIQQQVTEAHDRIDDVSARRAKTLDFMARARRDGSKGMLAVEIGNLRVGLHSVPVLGRIWGLPEHPWLAPLSTEQSQAEETHRQAIIHFQNSSEELRSKRFILQIERDQLRSSEERFLSTAETILVGHFDVEVDYLKVVPVREDFLARLFGQKFASDPTYHPDNFGDFVVETEDRWSQARKRNSRLPEQMTEIPFADLFRQLPKPIKDAYQRWLADQRKLSWAKARDKN
ncbi:MAG: hypothetical protein G01um10147_276 [Microgenomates group bacterium Gr01-1014_7]|nr:MAG: hypothetical protein G01um10147_276 [Microgenomates group bacterium Gr01-1014_7]